MASKKFKNDVELEAGIKLPNKTASKALVIDSNKDIVVSTTTDTEIGYLSGVDANLADVVREGDTTTAAMSFVVDEDNMASDLDTKVPTQQSVKKYVDDEIASALASEMTYKGAYDAATNTPNLDAGTPITVAVGDTYTVTVAGTFFTTAVEVGDMLISEVAQTTPTPTVEADWTIVNKNVDAATDATPGIVELATTGEVDTGTDTTRAITPAALAGSALQSDVDGHLDGTASKHDATEVDYERVDGSKKNIQATSDDVETAITDIDDAIGDITALGTPVNYSTADETEVAARLAGLDTALATAGTTEFDDATFKIIDEGFDNLGISFDVSAVTGGHKVITMPDAHVNLIDVNTALQPADASTELDHTQADPTDWTVANNSSIAAHLDEAGDRITNLEPHVSTGDIGETSYAGIADTASNVDVTGFAFASATIRSFDAHVSVSIDADTDLYETFQLQAVQNATGWCMSVESVGDDSLVSFSITVGGQIQYTKAATLNWLSTTIKFRAITTSK